MDQPARTCKLCGNPLPPMKGTGRPRVYCSDRCRNLAHEERIQERYERDPVEPPVAVPGSLLDRWAAEGAKFDDIVQDPYLLGRFVDDLMCRIAVDHILENHHYQHVVNQLDCHLLHDRPDVGGDLPAPDCGVIAEPRRHLHCRRAIIHNGAIPAA